MRETNVYVFDEEIEKLQREFHIMLENLEFLILRTTLDKEFIEFAAGNALEMIKIALREKDKVGIALW